MNIDIQQAFFNDHQARFNPETIVNVTVTEPEVTLIVDQTQIELESGKEVQLTVKEVTTTADGKTTERNVTTATTYKVDYNQVALVSSGLVRAKNARTTTITVKYGGKERFVNVTVTEPVVTLSVDPSQLQLQLGKQAQLIVKEVTTTADGNSTEKDVTKAANYTVANKKVLTVMNGLVSPKSAGSTTITIKYNKMELTVDVIVTEVGTRIIDLGSEVTPMNQSENSPLNEYLIGALQFIQLQN